LILSVMVPVAILTSYEELQTTGRDWRPIAKKGGFRLESLDKLRSERQSLRLWPSKNVANSSGVAAARGRGGR
jgi:hypothetical protein